MTIPSNNNPRALLLSRLKNVRQYGKGYRANCPIGHASHGTLSVGQTDTGTALLHCFVGCAAADVLAALGLTVADLYPNRLHDASPGGRKAARLAMQIADWRAALGVFARESVIVLAAIAKIQKASEMALPCDDRDRLTLAVHRIQSAHEVLTA